jgi:hypothetical protein
LSTIGVVPRKLPLSDVTAGVAEMAVNGTAAATVVQGQPPSGTATAGASPMDDENLSEMLRAQTTADIYG